MEKGDSQTALDEILGVAEPVKPTSDSEIDSALALINKDPEEGGGEDDQSPDSTQKEGENTGTKEGGPAPEKDGDHDPEESESPDPEKGDESDAGDESPPEKEPEKKPEADDLKSQVDAAVEKALEERKEELKKEADARVEALMAERTKKFAEEKKEWQSLGSIEEQKIKLAELERLRSERLKPDENLDEETKVLREQVLKLFPAIKHLGEMSPEALRELVKIDPKKVKATVDAEETRTNEYLARQEDEKKAEKERQEKWGEYLIQANAHTAKLIEAKNTNLSEMASNVVSQAIANHIQANESLMEKFVKGDLKAVDEAAEAVFKDPYMSRFFAKKQEIEKDVIKSKTERLPKKMPAGGANAPITQEKKRTDKEDVDKGYAMLQASNKESV